MVPMMGLLRQLRARLGREPRHGRDRPFRLTWSSNYRLASLAERGQLLCRKCGRPIELGDLIVYRGRTKTGRLRIYHAKCWERLWL